MSHTNIKLYGTNWCSDCKRSKKFLGEQRVHYEFINIEEDNEGQDFVQKLQNGGLTIPTIVFEDGSILIEPSNAELAAKLGTTEAALKMTVSRLRHRYSELLRAEIAQTVTGPEEVEEELRALFAALSG